MRGDATVPRLVCAMLGHAWAYEYVALTLPLVKVCERCGAGRA